MLQQNYPHEELMKSNKLRVTTVTLLRNRLPEITLSRISKQTTLPISWLKSFQKRGYEKDAYSDNVVTLYEFLTAKSLLK